MIKHQSNLEDNLLLFYPSLSVNYMPRTLLFFTFLYSQLELTFPSQYIHDLFLSVFRKFGSITARYLLKQHCQTAPSSGGALRCRVGQFCSLNIRMGMNILQPNLVLQCRRELKEGKPRSMAESLLQTRDVNFVKQRVRGTLSKCLLRA